MSATLQSKSKFPSIINLLLVIVLGISLAKLMWLVLTPAPKINTFSSSEMNSHATPKVQVDYGKHIADQHIFGEIKVKPATVAKAPPKKTEETAIAPTKLNLQLHGIVAYKSKKGFALISSGSGFQKVYGKGETIQDGVTVSNIFPEKVVLDNHGKTEELLLPVNKKSNSRQQSNNSTSNALLPGSRSQKKQSRSLSATASPNSSPNLSKLREEIMSNPTKLANIIRPSPAVIDGQFIGFRIRPGRQKAMFNQLNFRPNDIIMEVNGIVLDDANKGAMVLNELAQASSISVRVKRGNEEILIDHSF